MKSKRPFWIVTTELDKTPQVYGIQCMFAHFRLVYLQDAQKQADHPYCEASCKPYFLETAAKLLQETGRTLYFDSAGLNNDFCLKAQRNTESDASNKNWYGLRLESGHLTTANCKAFMKLCRLDSPQAAIVALKAKHAVYCRNAREWVKSDSPDYLIEVKD